MTVSKRSKLNTVKRWQIFDWWTLKVIIIMGFVLIKFTDYPTWYIPTKCSRKLTLVAPFFLNKDLHSIINYDQFTARPQCKSLLKTKTIDPNSFPRI